MSPLVAASFAIWSASSFLWCPVCALIQLNSIFSFYISISITFILIFSMRYVWFFRFLSDSNVIRLSVDTITVLSLVSMYCIFSSVFNIASCLAWSFEHRPFNLYFFVFVMLLSVSIAIPDPTPCSPLLPSVYTCMVCLLSSCPSLILTRVRWMCPAFCFYFPIDLVSIPFYTFIVLCSFLYFYVNRS